MSKKILIVDDEQDVLELLGTRLEGQGYEVVTLSDGRMAVSLAKKEKPDLIILDIVMPGVDGSEIANILKTDPQTKNTPVIFLTCLITKEEEKRDNVIGGKYFIAKPYDPDDLLKIIENLLQ